MWGGGTSIRRKERRNFNLHLLCSFWNNLEEQIIELPKSFVHSYRDIRHNTVFQCPKITSC